MISDSEIFVRSRAVVSRVVAGETLIVPVRGKVGDLASIYSFNETGSLIWKILDTPRTFPEVVSAVAEEYDEDAERVRPDVMRFLEEMRAASLVDVSQRQASAAPISVVENREGLGCAVESCAVEGFLAEVPGTAVVAGTEEPVGREGLAAADAR